MKRYLYILLLLLLCGYVASQNKSDTQKQNKVSKDNSQNLITKDKEDTTTIGGVKPVFDISIATLIDSVSNPKAYLYNQEFAPGSGYLTYQVQYLLVHKKSTIDTIEVGRNEDLDYPFSEGKIIQYFPYKKNAIGIAIELNYATCHSGAGWCAGNTFWSIFDLESKKRIFNCNPNSYSSSWEVNTYNPGTTIYYGYSIAINNMEIIIRKQKVRKDIESAQDEKNDYLDESGGHVIYTNERPDLKYGKYVWKDSSFVLIKWC